MADINDLPRLVIVLVMVGLILGIGILVLSKFGGAVAESTVVTKQEITISSSTGRTVNADQGITAFTSFINNTHNFDNNITANLINWTTFGLVTVDSAIGDGLYNITYTYDKNVTATDTSSNTIIALAPVASDWLPLIVTVAVLAIILGLVLSSFAVRAR